MRNTEQELATLGPACASPEELPARDGRLVRIGELVSARMDRGGVGNVPLNEAALDVAGKFDGTGMTEVFPVFRTRPAARAARLDLAHFTPKPKRQVSRDGWGPAAQTANWITMDGFLTTYSPFDKGHSPAMSSRRAVAQAPSVGSVLEGVAAALRKEWGAKRYSRDQLFSKLCLLSYYAIPEAVAEALFGYDLPAQVPGVDQSMEDVAAARDSRIVQPFDGETWPHTGGRWTKGERDAMFMMRHIGKMTDAEIAKVVGMSTTQNVYNQIGRRDGWDSDKGYRPDYNAWRPDRELLDLCGLRPEANGQQVKTLRDEGVKAVG